MGEWGLGEGTGQACRFPLHTCRRPEPGLMGNTAGKFKGMTDRGGDYFSSDHLSRGMCLGDLDNDGATDMVVANMNEPAAVLKNIACGSNGLHWAGFSLAKPDKGDVTGARVEVVAGGRSQFRFAKGGGSYASSPDRRLVVGLGTGDKIDRVTVRGPGG